MRRRRADRPASRGPLASADLGLAPVNGRWDGRHKRGLRRVDLIAAALVTVLVLQVGAMRSAKVSDAAVSSASSSSQPVQFGMYTGGNSDTVNAPGLAFPVHAP